jgi:hypothetical protein
LNFSESFIPDTFETGNFSDAGSFEGTVPVSIGIRSAFVICDSRDGEDSLRFACQNDCAGLNCPPVGLKCQPSTK